MHQTESIVGHMLRRRSPVTGRALFSAIALTALVALAGATHAVAHASLLRVTPSSSQTLAQAPDQVQLLFSEPLDPVFSNARVINAAGQSVDNNDSRVDPQNDRLLVVSLQSGLPNGVYTVIWRSLSAIDVHPDEGRYPLFVGVPVSGEVPLVASTFQITATPETTFGRWWFYVAASLFGGVLATWKFVFGGVLVGPYGAIRSAARRQAYVLIIAGGVLLILGTLFSAVAQAAAAADVPLVSAVGKPMADLLLRGRFASIWWPRIFLEVAGLFLIAIGGIEGLAAECALATLPAVLLTSALTSHGAALPAGPAPGIAIDWLHLVGATAWVGGLFALVACVPLLWRVESSLDLMRRLVDRFARFARVASLVVLLSGVLQSTLEVGTWSALLVTTYGNLVLLKIALLVAMLLLAGFNELQPRRGAAAGLRRGVGVELSLGIVVLGVAAMLSGAPPSPNG